VEVGTVTPQPQPGNVPPRIFRVRECQGLINRMGFPNEGSDHVYKRLRRARKRHLPGIVGVSIGKQKDTPLETAHGDYLFLMRKFRDVADYFSINISSPNTPRLRELQGADFLARLLKCLMEESFGLGESRRPAIFVKISPDLSAGELETIVGICLDEKVDGMIATNTTLSRSGLRTMVRREKGGLSGPPLAGRSTEFVREIHRLSAGKLPIIGVGGIDGPDQARRKLDAGASLLQVYTGLVWEGPLLAARILREIE